jgi:hypothetical protein
MLGGEEGEPMKGRTLGSLVLLLLVGFGVIPVGAQKTPPMEATVVHKGFKEGELVRVQTGAQVPMYSIVRHFYRDVFSALAGGEASFHRFLKVLDIQPESEPAKALARAALLVEALQYNREDSAKFLPDEKAYLEAQDRNIRAEKEQMVRIHAELLRRLQQADYRLDKLNEYFEKEIRPGVTITVYGGKPGEPDPYYKVIANFSQEVEAELSGAAQEERP